MPTFEKEGGKQFQSSETHLKNALTALVYWLWLGWSYFSSVQPIWWCVLDL